MQLCARRNKENRFVVEKENASLIKLIAVEGRSFWPQSQTLLGNMHEDKHCFPEETQIPSPAVLYGDKGIQKTRYLGSDGIIGTRYGAIEIIVIFEWHCLAIFSYIFYRTSSWVLWCFPSKLTTNWSTPTCSSIHLARWSWIGYNGKFVRWSRSWSTSFETRCAPLVWRDTFSQNLAVCWDESLDLDLELVWWCWLMRSTRWRWVMAKKSTGLGGTVSIVVWNSEAGHTKSLYLAVVHFCLVNAFADLFFLLLLLPLEAIDPDVTRYLEDIEDHLNTFLEEVHENNVEEWPWKWGTRGDWDIDIWYDMIFKTGWRLWPPTRAISPGRGSRLSKPIDRTHIAQPCLWRPRNHENYTLGFLFF